MRSLSVTLMIRKLTAFAGRHCFLTGFLSTLALIYILVSVEQTSYEALEDTVEILEGSHRFRLRDLEGQKLDADFFKRANVSFIQDDTYIFPKPEISWHQTQRTRRDLVQKTCRSHVTGHVTLDEALKTDLTAYSIVVDNQHKVVYCAIPKAACSSWRTFLATLTGKVNTSDHGEMLQIHDYKFLSSIGLKLLASYRGGERNKILETYEKILVVRHPFERLVSAFRDKFQDQTKWSKYFHLKYGRNIIAKFRRRANVKSKLTGYDVKFPEFIQWLNDPSIDPSFKFNPHWAMYQDLCQPCLIDYNNIISFDTFNEDTDHVLKTIFHINDTQEFFPHRNMKSTSSGDIVTEFFSSLPEAHVLKLKEIYRTDFEMFNYTWPR